MIVRDETAEGRQRLLRGIDEDPWADILERSLKNADGSPLATKEQIGALMGKNDNAIERLFEAACAVSGFSKKDVEVLEKN